MGDKAILCPIFTGPVSLTVRPPALTSVPAGKLRAATHRLSSGCRKTASMVIVAGMVNSQRKTRIQGPNRELTGCRNRPQLATRAAITKEWGYEQRKKAGK